MAVLRTVIDIEIGDDALSKGEKKQFAESLRDYAAVVLGPGLVEKTNTPLEAGVQWHNHRSEDGHCRDLYSTSKLPTE